MQQTYCSGRRTDGKKEDREEGGGIVEGWKGGRVEEHGEAEERRRTSEFRSRPGAV